MMLKQCLALMLFTICFSLFPHLYPSLFSLCSFSLSMPHYATHSLNMVWCLSVKLYVLFPLSLFFLSLSLYLYLCVSLSISLCLQPLHLTCLHSHTVSPPFPTQTPLPFSRWEIFRNSQTGATNLFCIPAKEMLFLFCFWFPQGRC